MQEVNMTKSRELGVRGEQRAAEHLEAAGYRIIDRNWRCRDGEIDIVAALDDVVAVVEVKTRTGHGAGHPFEAVTPEKVARLRRLALAWAHEHPVEGHRLRIDVVGVTVGATGSETIEHLRGVTS
jgi:putative endonuclease